MNVLGIVWLALELEGSDEWYCLQSFLYRLNIKKVFLPNPGSLYQPIPTSSSTALSHMAICRKCPALSTWASSSSILSNKDSEAFSPEMTKLAKQKADSCGRCRGRYFLSPRSILILNNRPCSASRQTQIMARQSVGSYFASCRPILLCSLL